MGFLFFYATRQRAECPAKNAVLMKKSSAATVNFPKRGQAEKCRSENALDCGGPANPEPREKWVEAILSGNANNWQIDRKSS
jgi:hypothetical protein